MVATVYDEPQRARPAAERVRVIDRRPVRVAVALVIGPLYGAAFFAFLGAEPLVGALIGTAVMVVAMWRPAT